MYLQCENETALNEMSYSVLSIKFADSNPCFEYEKPLPLIMVVKSFSDSSSHLIVLKCS